MKHDFHSDPHSPAADQFYEWLLDATIEDLKKHRGNAEQTKTSIFLLANRACEARMPDALLGGLIGKAVVRAGYPESDEAPVFAWLESFVTIARGVYGDADEIE